MNVDGSDIEQLLNSHRAANKEMQLKLALHGESAWVYQLCRDVGIAAIPLVEREATGKDLPEHPRTTPV